MDNRLFSPTPKTETRQLTGEVTLGSLTKTMPLFKMPNRDQYFIYFKLNRLIYKANKLYPFVLFLGYLVGNLVCLGCLVGIGLETSSGVT